MCVRVRACKSTILLLSINYSIRVSKRVNCLTWSTVPGINEVAIAELKQTIRQRNFVLHSTWLSLERKKVDG